MFGHHLRRRGLWQSTENRKDVWEFLATSPPARSPWIFVSVFIRSHSILFFFLFIFILTSNYSFLLILSGLHPLFIQDHSLVQIPVLSYNVRIILLIGIQTITWQVFSPQIHPIVKKWVCQTRCYLAPQTHTLLPTLQLLPEVAGAQLQHQDINLLHLQHLLGDLTSPIHQQPPKHHDEEKTMLYSDCAVFQGQFSCIAAENVIPVLVVV